MKTARQHSNVNILLQSALTQYLASNNLNNPVAFVEFLRGCFEPKKYHLTKVKATAEGNTTAETRFQILLDVLEEGAPPVSFSNAIEIAKIADEYHGNHSIPEVITTLEGTTEKGVLDIGYHFPRGSSGPDKGRLLNEVIRFSRPDRCLELGTYYGMSALFILAAQAQNRISPNLTTLEGFEPRITYSSTLLRQHYGDAVTFVHGFKKEELPKLAASGQKFGFLFHDAGHRGEDYINDFLTLLPVLEPGALVLIDDIRWNELAPGRVSEMGCYEGWLKVVSHDRVRHAVEVGNHIGLLFLNP